MLHCSQCRGMPSCAGVPGGSAQYCSRECQRSAWVAGHKRVCPAYAGWKLIIAEAGLERNSTILEAIEHGMKPHNFYARAIVATSPLGSPVQELLLAVFTVGTVPFPSLLYPQPNSNPKPDLKSKPKPGSRPSPHHHPPQVEPHNFIFEKREDGRYMRLNIEIVALFLSLVREGGGEREREKGKEEAGERENALKTQTVRHASLPLPRAFSPPALSQRPRQNRRADRAHR